MPSHRECPPFCVKSTGRGNLELALARASGSEAGIPPPPGVFPYRKDANIQLPRTFDPDCHGRKKKVIEVEKK